MSAPCLPLPAAGSAPAEADSAGGMEPPAGTTGTGSRTGAAGLELALEEELALLAAAGEPPEPPPVAAAVAVAAAAARDPELLSLIRQKEKDLVLAARLGKALLERNQDMSRQYERMHKELTDKLEHLEQEKHELRRRFENKEGEWEGRVSELESDVKQLQDELERQQVHLREADREKTRAVQELSEQNQRLLDQLSRRGALSHCSVPPRDPQSPSSYIRSASSASTLLQRMRCFSQSLWYSKMIGQPTRLQRRLDLLALNLPFSNTASEGDLFPARCCNVQHSFTAQADFDLKETF